MKYETQTLWEAFKHPFVRFYQSKLFDALLVAAFIVVPFYLVMYYTN
jgi:hypothetical protein